MQRRGVKGSEIDAVLFSHAHWYAQSKVRNLFTGTIVAQLPRCSPMRMDTLDLEQWKTVPLAIHLILSQPGTATSSTQNTKQRSSPNTPVPGKNSVPSKRHTISSATGPFG